MSVSNILGPNGKISESYLPAYVASDVRNPMITDLGCAGFNIDGAGSISSGTNMATPLMIINGTVGLTPENRQISVGASPDYELVVDGPMAVQGDMNVDGGIDVQGLTTNGEVSLTTGHLSFTSGIWAGTVALVAGSATIANTFLDANDIVLLTHKGAPTTAQLYGYTINPGVGFTILSTAPADVSTISYLAMKVN